MFESELICLSCDSHMDQSEVAAMLSDWPM